MSNENKIPRVWRLNVWAKMLAVFSAWCAGSGCQSSQGFVCDSNLECVSEGGELGICETSQSCSFLDPSCPTTQRRYPDGAAKDLVNQCIQPPAAPCIAQIWGGEEHFCMLKKDGTVWCWGANDRGQIGDGTRIDAHAPKQAILPPGTRAVAVYPGEASTCALGDDGRVYCWGANDTGAIGVAMSWTTDADGNDVPALDPTDVPAPTRVVDVLAADSAGLLKRRPVPVFKALGVGGKHACAISDSSEVYCWGENNRDQCGIDRNRLGSDDAVVPTLVQGLPEPPVQIATGDEHTLVLGDDGGVYAWGDNIYGQLGTGMAGDTTPSPVKVGITAVRRLAAGAAYSCASKEDGTVWCWGYGASGSLGLGNTIDQSTPQYVLSAKAIVTSGNSYHTCVISADQGLDCWGQNSAGAIGTGSVGEGQDSSTVEPAAAAIATVTMAATANTATCAVTTDDVLWCWGANNRGQLATPAATVTPIPTRANFACR